MTRAISERTALMTILNLLSTRTQVPGVGEIMTNIVTLSGVPLKLLILMAFKIYSGSVDVSLCLHFLQSS